MYVVNRQQPTRFVSTAFEQSGSALFGASLLKFVLFEMYNYLINLRPVLLGAPLQLGALSVSLVRLWVNTALSVLIVIQYCSDCVCFQCATWP